MLKETTILWHIGNMTFHGRTLLMAWITMICVIIFCLLGVRRLSSDIPGKMQNVLEWIVDFVSKIVGDNMENFEKGRSLISYLLTLIVFIFFANLVSIIPNFTLNIFSIYRVPVFDVNEIFSGPTLQAPTADINTTMALAILTILIVLGYGIKNKGRHYFHHFIEPNPIFLPIELLDLIAKPLTLAFRLFGNIYAGEILIKVILLLPGIWVLPGIVPNTIWLAFCIFVGAIQSFVFTVLTTAYVAQAVAESE